MPVPTYDHFIEPILRYLAVHPEGAEARDVYKAAAIALSLSEEDLLDLLPSGKQPTYKNRAGWAHDRLKRATLSSSVRWGWWQLTPNGMEFAASHPGPLSEAEVEKLAFASATAPLNKPSEIIIPEPIPTIGPKSPDDRLGEALIELRATLASELLETLVKVTPTFFETIVLDLLHKMGYGTSRSDLKRVGGSGDGGIDGVISLDKLGLDKVYVQAKRWQQNVGRPEIQGFYGALVGQRASKGIFITTSGFTSQALEFARSVDKIVLVDGTRIADLMIDYEVGVSARTIKVAKLDGGYFDEDSV